MKDIMQSWQVFLEEDSLYEEVYDIFYKEGLRPT
jgi:predicted phosphoadenosine phosphosulfate sulfurtransferase